MSESRILLLSETAAPTMRHVARDSASHSRRASPSARLPSQSWRRGAFGH